ncbi:MAG: membrane fusion protein (multidrug efflux system) [Candidatus Azotimanducaceae bacterium]|jgi:membrane fusion protein (multidrug efflux system)
MTDTTPPPVRAWKRWLLLLLVCVVLIAVLAGLKYQQIQNAMAFAASFPERSATVTAVTAETGSWTQVYRTIGEVRATRFVELRNEMEGRITKIGFVGGDKVAPGQVLLELESREEAAQLSAIGAQLKLAELKLQRIIELRADKMASPEDFDSAEANKAVLKADLAALTVRIEKKQLVAPFAATTNLHTLELGQYISANSIITGLTGNGEQLWLDFDLPQDKANISIGTSVTLSGRGIKALNLVAKVISAEPEIDQASRTRGYRALLTDAGNALSPGAVVDVAVETGIVNGVIRLPATAVRRNNFGAFVYLLAAAESDAVAAYRAARRPVTVARAEGEQVIITEGLEAGDLVAALGAFKLQAGLLVHVVERLPRKESEDAAMTDGSQ